MLISGARIQDRRAAAGFIKVAAPRLVQVVPTSTARKIARYYMSGDARNSRK
jgi:hypothetical protein